MQSRFFRHVIAGLGAIGAALAAVWFFVLPGMNTAIAGGFGRGDYVLAATDGTDFTEKTLSGSPSAVFFGFTHCPEVCPTTLGDIALWQEELGNAGPIRVFFITVDPERDTAGLLRDYVGWVPGVTGVTGSREEIYKAIKAFRVYARKVALSQGGYTMDHSASILLFDANGNLFEPIGYQEDLDRVLAKLRRLLDRAQDAA
jgi:protein SCO1/2